MDDPASRGHPLHITRANSSFMPHAVAMLSISIKHVRDRFDAPVWMPGKPGKIMGRIIGTEIIKKKERVQLWHLIEPEGSFQMDASAFDGRLALQYFSYLSDLRHKAVLS